MATYIYETIPRQESDSPRRFEIVQSMKDAPLTAHPETGEPVRRVISGGYGIMSKPQASTASARSTAPAPCAAGCACHAGPRVPTP
jgi:predicted nucleic acid-binding Zn ribbon protein